MTPPPGPFKLVYRAFDRYTFDPAKSDEVLESRDFDLSFLRSMFPGWVLERRDTRTYREVRYQAIGEILGTVYFVVYKRSGSTCRFITGWEADRDDQGLWYDAKR